MVTKIKLTRGKEALVDDEDCEKLKGTKWLYATVGYAIGRVNNKLTYLHHIIIPIIKGQQIDHINSDKLDNRKENLRIATASQNRHNRPKYKKNAQSKYKGVCRFRDRWKASIKFKYKDHHIGLFAHEEDAAKAYDEMAKKLHGEFANLNFPESK